MKKKIVSVLLCAAMVAVLGAAGCGGDDASSANTDADTSADAETSKGSSGKAEYKLTLHQHDPENSAAGQFLNNWAAAVEENSDGRIEVNVYHGATLGGAKDTLDMIQNGTCDIGWGLQSFFDGVFPVTEVFMLPCIDITRASQGSAAIWNFYNSTDYMDEEYADYHVLLLHTNCQSPIETVSKKIESVDDLAGLQIRGNAGPPTDFIQNLGATPASCAITELYTNLEKGTMDGAITDWHGVASFKLDETVGYYLDENIGVSTYFLLMNKDVYESLPEDLQQVLDDTSSECIQYTSAWDTVEDETKVDESVASKLYNLSDDERAKLEAVADETAQQWIEEMNAAGYDGQAIYDTAMQCIEDAK